MPDARSLAAAAASVPVRREAGFTVEVLDAAACLEHVPQMEPRFPLAGELFAPDSPIGDCRAFTRGLVDALAKAGVVFRFATRVERRVVDAGRVHGVWSGGDLHPADVVVVAAGNETARLLRGWAPPPPIAPLSGYSITLPIGPGAPDASSTDPRRAVATLGTFFQQAADRLNATQPAISARIAALENILGVKLFDRSGHRVALTPHGRQSPRCPPQSIAKWG